MLILVVLQLWLLTATMNACLGGDDAVVWPALGASVVCLLLNLGLLRYLYRMTERSPPLADGPRRDCTRRTSRW